eukprot:14935697-Alexandrium_andersonii.AAC.1
MVAATRPSTTGPPASTPAAPRAWAVVHAHAAEARAPSGSARQHDQPATSTTWAPTFARPCGSWSA